MLFKTTLDNMINSQRCTVLSVGASEVEKKIFFFLRNGYIWQTQRSCRGVYLRELIMKFKAVHNVVSNEFYLDHKVVESNLTAVFF